MQRNFEPMRNQVEAWPRSELTDVTAKVAGRIPRSPVLTIVSGASAVQPPPFRITNADAPQRERNHIFQRHYYGTMCKMANRDTEHANTNG